MFWPEGSAEAAAHSAHTSAAHSAHAAGVEAATHSAHAGIVSGDVRGREVPCRPRRPAHLSHTGRGAWQFSSWDFVRLPNADDVGPLKTSMGEIDPGTAPRLPTIPAQTVELISSMSVSKSLQDSPDGSLVADQVAPRGRAW